MARIFLVALILALVWPQTVSAQSNQPVTNNDQYLRAWLRISDAKQLEKEGDFKSSYLAYCNGLLNLIPLRNDPDWEVELVDKLINDCENKLEELKLKILKGPFPPPDDHAEIQFAQALAVDLKNWENLHGSNVLWASKQIAIRIVDDKEILTALSHY